MAFATTIIASIERLIRIFYFCIFNGTGAIVIISDICPIGYRWDKRTVFGVHFMIPMHISIVVEIVMFHKHLLSFVLGTPQDLFRNLYINYRRYLKVIQGRHKEVKLGKAKLKRILSEETGIPIGDITIYGRYEYFGNKERLVIGSHTIVATNGRIFISSPVIREYTEDVTYKSREIKVAPINEAATSGRSTK